MDERRSTRERMTLWVLGTLATLSACYTVVLTTLVDRIVLIHQFKAGALTPWIIFSVTVWTAWLLVLLNHRQAMRWTRWGIGVLSTTLLAVLAWTFFSGHTQVEEVETGPGRFQEPASPSNTPENSKPSSPPTNAP
ncbi:hypothetical protein [Streptomyces sp. NPDC090021]|uniref:hypothetical protein n=1 Tax=Streptomyces sp. NPDC090021 TaxID=3365919 RepID=UPI0037FC1057